MSKRGEQWKVFSEKVLKHIDEYTVPQYGDRDGDSVSKWDSKETLTNISRYVKRFGQNSRPDQDLLDMVKMAHYACLAHDKMKREQTTLPKHFHFEGNMKGLMEQLISTKEYENNENVQITVINL